MTLSSNCPVASMLTLGAINHQVIKLSAIKSKIQEMVATRYPMSGYVDGRNDEKTKLIINCDDGSLKIYVADMIKTVYWLEHSLNVMNPFKMVINSDFF